MNFSKASPAANRPSKKRYYFRAEARLAAVGGVIEMSAAYFIVSETPIEGFDLFVNGKALAHASDWLDQLAEGAGVRPLMDYFSMDPEEVDALFDGLNLEPGPANGSLPPEDGAALATADLDDPDDDFDPSDPTLEPAPPEEWFTAEEGLTTVRALIQAVQDAPTSAVVDPFDPTPDAILADLREFESVLDHLATAEIRWHLSVDF